MIKILIAACLVFSITVQGQFTTDYLKAADGFYKKGDYYSAAQYYEKYLTGGKSKGSSDAYNPYVVQASSKKSAVPTTSKEQAVYNLAESYRLLNYFVKAEPHYRQAVSFDAIQFPLARYHFAETLRALEKFEEAEKAFNEFLDHHNGQDTYAESAKREILNLRFIRQQLKRPDLNLFTLVKAPATLNTEGANYAPVWMNGTTLLFTSTRPDSSAGKTQVHNNRLYTAEWIAGAPSNITEIKLPELKDVHQGVASLSDDGNTLYFTRWTIGQGTKTSSIYVSRKSGSGWSTPGLLEGEVNAEGFSAQQPFVMPGGKQLLYSSNKGGGIGGFDLWSAELNAEGKVTATTNLGPSINTSFDEQAPYFHAPSGSLVFASNGRVGMGGFDLFQSTGTAGKWSEPVNLGYPANYVKDDIYFTSRGGARNLLEDVLFSSDRDAACCLQLFSLKKSIPAKQISGLVVACETGSPLAGASIMIIDTVSNRKVLSKTIGSDGAYTFTADEYAPLKAVATAEGYHPGTLRFHAPAEANSLTLSNPAICLEKILTVGTTVVLNNVYYAFNKAVVLEESFAALDGLADLLNRNPEMTIEISGHTDSQGDDTYNQKLSEARAKSVVQYLITKGIDGSRLQARGYGEAKPIAPNKNPDGTDNPEGRKQNRRTEFKVLSN
jgi:outer membrane protein OmpA-like peptidoglycan-associated protein